MQKGLDQIPGLGFLRNVNRAGVAAAGGLGLTTGLWALTGWLDWKVKYPTLTGGWEESPLTALCVVSRVSSLARLLACSLARWLACSVARLLGRLLARCACCRGCRMHYCLARK
jgi:hypothetical protein